MPFLQDIATIAFYFGLSIATSAGIFGLIYSIRARKEMMFVDHWKALAVGNLALLMLGGLVAILAWFFAAIFHPFVSFAQEGIPFIVSQEVEVSILRWQALGAVALCLFAVFGFFPLRYRSAKTWQHFERYYLGIILVGFATLLLPITVTRDSFGIFLSVYHISSMLTVGSIFSVGFMYIFFRTTHRHTTIVRDVFTLHKKLFWLGMTVSSISFVFLGDSVFGTTTNFILTQIVLSVALFSIALLGGPILTLFINPKNERVHEFLHLIGSIFVGTIAVSWVFLSITNGLEAVDLSFRQLIILYGALLTSFLTVIVFVEYYLQKQRHLL